ncbi:hypothetical protein AEQ27_03905 [Frigoribacterium sp. RIT-PI-h]|nr:hypothetical protein AEQ27_03905 [Frigoribacterium sp. RIT-PI-h]
MQFATTRARHAVRSPCRAACRGRVVGFGTLNASAQVGFGTLNASAQVGFGTPDGAYATR